MAELRGAACGGTLLCRATGRRVNGPTTADQQGTVTAATPPRLPQAFPRAGGPAGRAAATGLRPGSALSRGRAPLGLIRRPPREVLTVTSLRSLSRASHRGGLLAPTDLGATTHPPCHPLGASGTLGRLYSKTRHRPRFPRTCLLFLSRRSQTLSWLFLPSSSRLLASWPASASQTGSARPSGHPLQGHPGQWRQGGPGQQGGHQD